VRSYNKTEKRYKQTAGWIRIGVLLVTCFSGCAIHEKRSTSGLHRHSFIEYWPPENSEQLTLAVKDNIDIKGVVTSAGSAYIARTNPPAARDAACLAIARSRNVKIVGKTNLSEFALSPSGINDYYGTPRNPFSRWSKFIPGGSSSGSAAAVASGLVDIAFGTDSAGSVRVPAACCGIVGLKTTFGLISLKGVFPVEPKHLDTVGPMGKDIEHVVQGMDLLENGFAARYQTAVAAKPSAREIRIGRLYLNGTDPKIDKAIDDALTRAHFKVIPLDRTFQAKWDQAKKDGNTLAAAGAWMSDQKYSLANGVGIRTKAVIALGGLLYETEYQNALRRRPQWQRTLRQVFRKVDFVALPTLQTLPPRIPVLSKIPILEALVLDLQNTVPVNVAGNPALALPVPLNDKKVPVTSLQLIGPNLSEPGLLNAGRLIENSVPAVRQPALAQKTRPKP
jgi:Asp-tRNAAsn/Glu-tRNAGln amidotransferase A subunit and related amidases